MFELVSTKDMEFVESRIKNHNCLVGMLRRVRHSIALLFCLLV